VSGDGSVRALTDLFLKWGTRRTLAGEVPAATTAPGVDAASVFPTKAFRKFLSSLASREAPVLVDVGQVVGANVTFFGERLGCKIFVEDVFADIERHARANALDALPEFLSKRIAHADASVDGILCWDLMDYLDRPSSVALAQQLVRVLRPGGSLLAFFNAADARVPHYTKYVVVDDASLHHKALPSARPRQPSLQNRDIIRMFEGLLVSDSFLLKTNTREILFRKPAYVGSVRAPI
jgi:hypothetical protein